MKGGDTETCTAGLRQCENMCGYLPQQISTHDISVSLKGDSPSSICSFIYPPLLGQTVAGKHGDVPTEEKQAPSLLFVLLCPFII